ncbi:PD-(D/E)XK nuclease-like transposase [Thiocapsa rosea]|uniref:PD-(D/E)XK nuclease-like transposase n=1 Tax=Thiocapsa rosea TaxID=69360 RepID=A0A495VBW4_9GAMM|nr:PD-(D/E)XK nuclease-like transposase [Thiocapsa rosea]
MSLERLGTRDETPNPRRGCNLLVHFLNALLAEDLEAPVAEVDILNPYNERETLDDKLTIVDVKARDQQF